MQSGTGSYLLGGGDFGAVFLLNSPELAGVYDIF